MYRPYFDRDAPENSRPVISRPDADYRDAFETERPSHRSRRRSASPEDIPESKEERRARRKAKRERKEAKIFNSESSNVTYGAHGILTESDIFTKDAEYRAWLVEEKMLNPETLSSKKMSEYFRIFMEDFNTSTFTNDKYYNIDEYERRIAGLKMGASVVPDRYDFRQDEEAIKSSHRRAKPTGGHLSKEDLLDLQRIERERSQAQKMKQLGIEGSKSLGVRYDT